MPPPQLIVEPLSYGVLLPAAITTVILILVLWLGKRYALPAERIGGALALAVGFASGFAKLEGEQVTRADPWFWLPFLAGIAVVGDLVDLIPRAPIGLRWSLRALVALLTAWLLVPLVPEAALPRWFAIVEATVFLLWALLDPLAERQPGGLIPLLLSLIALAGGVVVHESGFDRMAQLLGSLAGILGGCALVSWWQPHRHVLRGMIPGVAVLLPGLLFLGWFYVDDMPWLSLLLVLAAPLTLWVSALPPLGKMNPRWRRLIQAVVVLVPAGLAVIRVLLGSPSDRIP